MLETTGLLPHINAGALYRHELEQLRTVSASQGMMLESLADLPAHRLAPDKDPGRNAGNSGGMAQGQNEKIANIPRLGANHESSRDHRKSERSEWEGP